MPCLPCQPWCRCGEGGRFPFRMCTLKRVPDPASPPLWDEGRDWTSGAVVWGAETWALQALPSSVGATFMP